MTECVIGTAEFDHARYMEMPKFDRDPYRQSAIRKFRGPERPLGDPPPAQQKTRPTEGRSYKENRPQRAVFVIFDLRRG